MINVSIIVPVYNVEQYLRKCVDSLIHQTLSGIEVILVSDASKDGSILIMKEYEEEYPDKVKCIYLEENLSQGGARNKGLEIATGQYVMFVDSDDWIDTRMCEKLFEKAQRDDLDIVGCDYYKVQENTGIMNSYSLYYSQQCGVLNKSKRASLFFTYAIPWAKIIKRNLIIENDLYFPVHMKYEDYAMVPLLFLYATSMGVIDEPLYFYNIRTGSTSRQVNDNHIFDVIQSGKVLRDSFVQRGYGETYPEEIEGLYIKQIYNALNKILTLADEINYGQLSSLKGYLSEIFPSCKENPYFNLITNAFAKIVADFIINHDIHALDKEKLQWLKGKTNYHELYRTEKNRINRLMDICEEKGYSIGIWGAGIKGNDFLAEVDKEGKRIAGVIDTDSRKHGTRTNTNHEVISDLEAATKVDVVIMMNKLHYKGNKETIKIKSNAIRTFNIELYLFMKDMDIEEFIE